MKKVFVNGDGIKCIFTDDGVSLCGEKQESFFPDGSIDSIHMSLLGILQVTHRNQVLTFAVDRKDRAEMKASIKEVTGRIKNAAFAEPYFFDTLNPSKEGLSAEEELKEYKAMFVAGAITKEQFDLKKRLLK